MTHLARCLFPLIFFLAVGVGLAQEATQEPGLVAYFTADNFTPLMGERITVTLIVEIPLNLEIAEWPEFPSDQYPFEVMETHDRTEQEQGDTQYFRQTFTIIIWRPGEFRTPELTITYHDIENDETHSVPIEPAFFNVPTQLSGVDDSLRPFKPQIYLPYLSPLTVLVVGLILSSAGWYGYQQWQQRVRRPKQQIDITTPYSKAIAILTQLEKQAAPAEMAYPQVADCVRTYIQDHFTVAAHELTTTELIDTLRQHPAGLEATILADLERLLQQADLVKFAGISPSDDTVGRLLKFAHNWLTTADQHLVGGDAV